MRFKSLLLFILFFPVFAFSQVVHVENGEEDERKLQRKKNRAENPPHFGLGVQLNVGKYEKPKSLVFEFVTKFGDGYYSTAFGYKGYRCHLISLGSEFATTGFNGNDLLIGPKLTYEFTWIILSARSEFVWYKVGNSSDPRFSLGGGIAFYGWFGVYYVYQIPLSKHHIWEVNNNKFSFTLRIPIGMKNW